jgi:mono/diheme cytochrome c family protein
MKVLLAVDSSNRPHTDVDSSGNVTVNGYETEDEPRMPQFRLSDQEISALSAYLSSLKSHPIQPYQFPPAVVAALSGKPDLVDQGEARFREMFCTTCHSIAVTRGEETKLIGGDIGPELTKVASKVNPDWLVTWLRDPSAQLPHALMPRYQWSDEDLYKVTQYISAKLTDSDLLTNVPQLEEPSADDVQTGQRLFAEKGCASCHSIQGVTPQKTLVRIYPTSAPRISPSSNSGIPRFPET